MYSTIDEKGILNNYASEPKLYYAVSPSPSQQRKYLYQGALAVLLVSSLLLTALAVS